MGKYGRDLHGHMLEHSMKLLHEVNLVLTYIEAILNRFFKVGISEKMIFEQRFEGGEEESHSEVYT